MTAGNSSLLRQVTGGDNVPATANSYTREMKAISLWQPWASLIAWGYKSIETRDWPTGYRGPLAIHAAKRPMQDDERKLLEELNKRFPDAQIPQGKENYPLGCMVATTELAEVRPTKAVRDTIDPLERQLGGYRDGRYAWFLENIKPLRPPIPARGRQGLWDWDEKELS